MTGADSSAVVKEPVALLFAKAGSEVVAVTVAELLWVTPIKAKGEGTTTGTEEDIFILTSIDCELPGARVPTVQVNILPA